MGLGEPRGGNRSSQTAAAAEAEITSGSSVARQHSLSVFATLPLVNGHAAREKVLVTTTNNRITASRQPPATRHPQKPIPTNPSLTLPSTSASNPSNLCPIGTPPASTYTSSR